MANYICSEPIDVLFIGDGVSTTLNYDLTAAPFYLPFHDNYAGLFVDSYGASAPAGTTITQTGTAENQILTFNQPFTSLQVTMRQLWESL